MDFIYFNTFLNIMTEQIKNTTTGYTYTSSVPVGYTSKILFIQPLTQPIPPSLEPPQAISMLLNKPTTPPNRLLADQLPPVPHTPSKEVKATSKKELDMFQVLVTPKPKEQKLLLKKFQ